MEDSRKTATLPSGAEVWTTRWNGHLVLSPPYALRVGGPAIAKRAVHLDPTLTGAVREAQRRWP